VGPHLHSSGAIVVQEFGKLVEAAPPPSSPPPPQQPCSTRILRDSLRCLHTTTFSPHFSGVTAGHRRGKLANWTYFRKVWCGLILERNHVYCVRIFEYFIYKLRSVKNLWTHESPCESWHRQPSWHECKAIAYPLFRRGSPQSVTSDTKDENTRTGFIISSYIRLGKINFGWLFISL